MVALLLLTISLLAPGTFGWRTVTFTSPSVEPGTNEKGLPVVNGGMPIGNGDTTAVVFPVTVPFNTSEDFELSEGVHIMVGMRLRRSLRGRGVLLCASSLAWSEDIAR